MSTYVEECRREWRRLRVPDGLAEEMAAELEADLAEAEADGVSAAEMLGESDPRRFAATWARERGLVSDEPPRKSRKWLWIVLAAVLLLFVLMVVTLTGLAFATGGGGSGTPSRQTPVMVRPITVPNVVGMKACKAVRILARTNVDYWRNAGHGHGFPCDQIVLAQTPVGRVIKRGDHQVVVTLRLGRS